MIEIGLVLFPELTQLDLTGPFEVFSKLPDTHVHLVAKGLEPVTDSSGLRLLPSTTFSACPALDVICVPGGRGIHGAMEDEATLAFIRRQAAGARYVTSVCSGSLVLGAAGLLKGRRAACHWMSRALLARFGAIPDEGRVVRDGNLITGGGVTAGIDFALTVAAELAGTRAAQLIQLSIEYAPAPPFQSGSPREASPELVAEALRRNEPQQRVRVAVVERAAARLR